MRRTRSATKRKGRSPKEIGSLVAWWRSDDQNLKDITGQHVLNGFVQNKPNSVNGKSTWVFDGKEKLSTILPKIEGSFSIVVFLKVDKYKPSYVVNLGTGKANANASISIWKDGSYFSSFGGIANLLKTKRLIKAGGVLISKFLVPKNQWSLLLSEHNNHNLFVNGDLQENVKNHNSKIVIDGLFTVGYYPWAEESEYPFFGEIAEIAIFDKHLTTEEKTKLTEYIQDQYKVSWFDKIASRLFG